MSGRSSIEGVLVDWVITQPVPSPRLPASLLDRAQTAAELQRVQAERAMLAAYEAELVLGLADESPDRFDPPADHPGARRPGWAGEAGLPGISEFFPHELALVLNCGRGTASHLAARAWAWRAKLPATWQALAAGELDEPRAKALAEVLGLTSPEIAQAVERDLLPQAAGLSLARLRARALELLLKHDAHAAEERRRQARRAADVRCYPSPLEGMSTLAADLPAPVSAECFDLVDRLAKMLKAHGDGRAIGELRATVLADLIRRPWDTRLPAVTAHVSVTAPLPSLAGRSSEPGTVAGLPITAAHVRELLAQVGALGLHAPAGGSLTLAVTDADGNLLATVTPAELRRLARRGCPAHPEVQCSCSALGRPRATARYEPTAAQRAWVLTRDRTCRFPNCGQRVGWADLDHVVAHASGGETDCVNLCCLCRSHHRLKTFARGWRFELTADGTLLVTTPSGVTRATRPPGVRPPRPQRPAGTGSEPPATGPEPAGTGPKASPFCPEPPEAGPELPGTGSERPGPNPTAPTAGPGDTASPEDDPPPF